MNREPGWAHLIPVVEALVERGNSAEESGFVPNQGGWDCSMAQPIDFDRVREVVDGDNRVRLLDDRDEVFCAHCWSSIVGPGVVLLDSAIEQRDGSPSVVELDGSPITLMVGRQVVVHAVKRHSAEPLCGQNPPTCLATGWAWKQAHLPWFERCDRCLALAPEHAAPLDRQS